MHLFAARIYSMEIWKLNKEYVSLLILFRRSSKVPVKIDIGSFCMFWTPTLSNVHLCQLLSQSAKQVYLKIRSIKKPSHIFIWWTTTRSSLDLIMDCSAAVFGDGIESDNVNMEESTMNHHSFLCYNDIGKHWDSSKPLGAGSFIVFPEPFKCHSISWWRRSRKTNSEVQDNEFCVDTMWSEWATLW